MYASRTHGCADRIVSLHQPYVRPIVRGKATAKTEFGAKLTVSLVEGYAGHGCLQRVARFDQGS